MFKYNFWLQALQKIDCQFFQGFTFFVFISIATHLLKLFSYPDDSRKQDSRMHSVYSIVYIFVGAVVEWGKTWIAVDVACWDWLWTGLELGWHPLPVFVVKKFPWALDLFVHTVEGEKSIHDMEWQFLCMQVQNWEETRSEKNYKRSKW